MTAGSLFWVELRPTKDVGDPGTWNVYGNTQATNDLSFNREKTEQGGSSVPPNTISAGSSKRVWFYFG